MNGQDRPPHLP